MLDLSRGDMLLNLTLAVFSHLPAHPHERQSLSHQVEYDFFSFFAAFPVLN